MKVRRRDRKEKLLIEKVVQQHMHDATAHMLRLTCYCLRAAVGAAAGAAAADDDDELHSDCYPLNGPLKTFFFLMKFTN